jgi:hypothetical protein
MNRPATEASSVELCQILGALPEKFIVDFANGIDVADDHIAVQRMRGGIFSRLYDGFTGQGQRRQSAINASLKDGVAGSLTWLTELTASQAKSNFAIGQVQLRVDTLQSALIDVAHHTADTREQLVLLAQQLSQRSASLEHEMQRLDMVQQAGLHLDVVTSKWQAGGYASLSPAGRCYAALEELRWGRFGDFYRSTAPAVRAGHMELLYNRIHIQLTADAGAGAGAGATLRLDIREWLRPSAHAQQQDVQLALAYLGDWADPASAPFVFAAANVPTELPMHLPRLCSAERLTLALADEVFQELSA